MLLVYNGFFIHSWVSVIHAYYSKPYFTDRAIVPFLICVWQDVDIQSIFGVKVLSTKYTFGFMSTAMYSLHVMSKSIAIYICFMALCTRNSEPIWLEAWKLSINPRFGEKRFFFSKKVHEYFYLEMFLDVCVKGIYVGEGLLAQLAISQRLK